MSNVQLKNINKIYDGNVHAVHDFNLDIADKEFIVFVGPSGCGKSTTLRMIAGLEEITTGELYIDGVLVNNVAPKDRNIAMVFQSYALYPQMTVEQNMSYSLKLHKVPKEEIKRRVEEAARVLGLTDLLKRKPKALSGGQRQRVALGRAIVRNPKVFLMDEPLSNLDAKLRVQMRSEISRIHNDVGATTIYVTHDQVEAMTMASRIVVMSAGYVQQIGTPTEIYENPDNMFVAGFIGTPPMNFIHGVVTDDGKGLRVSDEVCIPLSAEHQKILAPWKGMKVVYGIRPEHLMKVDDPKKAVFSGEVTILELLGDVLHCYIKVNGCANTLIMKTSALNRIRKGDIVAFSPNDDFACFFDEESTNRIRLGDVKQETEK